MAEQIVIRGLSSSSKITGELSSALEAAELAFDKPDLRKPHYSIGLRVNGRTFNAERLEDGSIQISCAEKKNTVTQD